MFGSALKVDFNFKQDSKTKNVHLPGKRWIDLRDFTLYKADDDKFGVDIQDAKVGIDNIAIYQNAEGTVVPLFEPNDKDVSRIEDLQKMPLSISIALNEHDSAWGHVLIEEGTNNGLSEFYEIRAQQNIIQIRQQNSGKVENSAMASIHRIIVTPREFKPVNTVCALKRNLKTVVPMYTASSNDISYFTI